MGITDRLLGLDILIMSIRTLIWSITTGGWFARLAGEVGESAPGR
jgi:hypothetical protein